MTRVAEPTELPPPWEPPLAESANPKLVAFIYLLLRIVPAREIEGLVETAVKRGDTTALPNRHLAAYADQIARALVATCAGDGGAG